ncbi:hypothetical protein DMN91_005049 [Ooceraea biroi]|uniref:Small ribosomal subunit protein mS23 conserved domain-containing protein n=1 Tax=Ooceraea biroi TaxID=2015173 RepID=A0A3L8DQV6_OOCBI|nr:hypothetical protein DMN91_005049 [Ooceraea biroi]
MAQSRLERIGTVYTRVISLLKGKGMKSEDKPLWVSVYEAFPPKKFHRDQSFMPATDLATENVKSMTQRFLVTYKSIREKEKLEEDEAYEQALQQYNSEREARMESRKVGNETSRRL